MNRFMECILDFLLGNILSWKISERAMWIFRRILVLPWLVRLIVLLAEDSLELILA
jgi:hypothetical protein